MSSSSEVCSPDTGESEGSPRRRVQRLFERSGLMRHLNARLGEVAKGRAHVHLPYGPELTQHHGYFHGGATAAIADSAGGYAALTVLPADQSVLTVEFKINLLAPAQGESLEAVGQVVRSGKTLSVVRVDVYALRSGEKTPVAVMQQTLMAVPDR